MHPHTHTQRDTHTRGHAYAGNSVRQSMRIYVHVCTDVYRSICIDRSIYSFLHFLRLCIQWMAGGVGKKYTTWMDGCMQYCTRRMTHTTCTHLAVHIHTYPHRDTDRQTDRQAMDGCMNDSVLSLLKLRGV
mmetsp:Transcript_28025/g.80683  ORF Transcript_28025/g.80683 Transcript_28025/m.80683 type:complete len:131 (-) Transcript_28025:64-456(-)